MNLQTSQNKSIHLADQLGQGGEATVYHIAEQPDIVAKLYHHPTAEREAKLTAMVANPPAHFANHIAIAWPTETLFNNGRFVGFTMPKVVDSLPIFNAYNPMMRQKQFPNFNRRHLHRIAGNLAMAMAAIHVKGHLIGDLNESNVLVNNQALVTLVDTDSFQVTDLQGQVHRCPVGKPEYTPPEMHGVPLKKTTQRVEHDWFGLGVLLFQLLMEGFHPFTGVLNHDLSVERVDLYAIREGNFPYDGRSDMMPPPAAPPFYQLHPDLQAAFVRCFVEGHTQPYRRPTTDEWRTLLAAAEETLLTCQVDSNHQYANHLSHCPRCERQPELQKPLLPEEVKPLSPLSPKLLPQIGGSWAWAAIIFTITGLLLISCMTGLFMYTTMISQIQIQIPSHEPPLVVNEPPIPPPLNSKLIPDEANRILPAEVIEVGQLSQSIRMKAFSFSPNGAQLAVAGDEGYFVYDTTDQQEVYFVESDSSISIAYSPDGQTIAVGTWNGGIDLFQAADGQQIRRLVGHAEERITSVAFSPDGRTLLSGSADQTARLWSLESGEMLLIFEGHTDQVSAVAFSPDGQTIATASWDETVRLWQASSGELLQTLSDPTSSLLSVAFSPDGQRVAGSGFGREVYLWQVADGTVKEVIKTEANSIRHVSFTPLGQLIFGNKESLYLQTLGQAQPLLKIDQPNNELLKLSPDGQTIASAGSNGANDINLWRISDLTADGQLDLQHTIEGYRSAITTLAFGEEGKTLASSGRDGKVRLWNLSNRFQHAVFEQQGTTTFINSLAISPRGRWLAAGNISGEIHVWQADGSFHAIMKNPQDGPLGVPVETITFTPDGEFIISGNEDGIIRRWTVGGKLVSELGEPGAAVTGVALSADGVRMISGSDDGVIRVWDASSGNVLHELEGDNFGVDAIGLTTDGHLAVSTGVLDGLHLWDVKAGRSIDTFDETSTSLGSVAFSPDSQWLAAGAYDGGIVIRSVGDDTTPYRVSGHDASVTSLAFSPDSRVLASSSEDGTIRLWAVSELEQ